MAGRQLFGGVDVIRSSMTRLGPHELSRLGRALESERPRCDAPSDEVPWQSPAARPASPQRSVRREPGRWPRTTSALVLALTLSAGSAAAACAPSVAESATPSSSSVTLMTTPTQRTAASTTSTVAKPSSPPPASGLTPRFFQALGDVDYGYTGVPKGGLVLTFDDGPSSSVTPRVLSILERHHVRGAVFFVTGQNATAHPDLIRRIVADGEYLGDHTWDHANLTQLSSTAVLRELERTDAAVDRAVGYDYPLRLVRPPYGAQNSLVKSVIRNQYNGRRVLWQIDTEDWKVQAEITKHEPVPHTVKDNVLAGVASLHGHGGVMLMHDIHSNTANELDGILTNLEHRGWDFVPITALG